MAIRYLLEIGDTPDIRISSAVRNEMNPSDARYSDSDGNFYQYDVRLEVPSISHQLSDAISGSIILSEYSLTIANDDGKYDGAKSWINKTAILKRSDVDDPSLEDFNTIMKGTVSYPVISQNEVEIVVNSTYRELTEEVTNTFNITDYPNVGDSVLDKDIPIGYGDLDNVPVYLIDTDEYIALDPDYITAVSDVYDIDGNSIAFTFNPANGQINAVDAHTADVTGLTTKTIGYIIQNEVVNKSSIPYTWDDWDILETDKYISTSASVNFYFSGGTVRELVDSVLKSDNAFFFSKNNGLLTIRQWGRLYTSHDIEAWQLTEFPTIDNENAQTYYNSSVLLQYNKDISNDDYQNDLIIGDDDLYDKVLRQTYPVDIESIGELTDLGNRLILRFATLQDEASVSVGVPTSQIELLDTVMLPFNDINGRNLSDNDNWIVKEVNPAQDTLVLESWAGYSIDGVVDGVLSQPHDGTVDGILSQPFNTNNGIGVLAQPIAVT